MDPEKLFRENLPVIDRVSREVCRGARLRDDDADDFASSVKLALLEDDYAILRKWEGRCSLAGYLSVVIRRLLSDRRDHELGRWTPSAEATRCGASGVLLETLLIRDGRPLAEVLPIVMARDPSLTSADVTAMAGRLPRRHGRLRAVALEEAAESSLASREHADARALSADVRRLSARASEVVRRALDGWEDEDVMIIRFRYGSSMSIADISRMLRLPQRPLYRRIEALLNKLGSALGAAGLDAAVLSSVIGEASQEMDFGFDGKTHSMPPSGEVNPAAASGEEQR